MEVPCYLFGTTPQRSSRSRSGVRVLAHPAPSLSMSKWKPLVSVFQKPLQEPSSTNKGDQNKNEPKPPFRPCICNFPFRWKSAMTRSRSSKSSWCSARSSCPSRYSSVSRSEPRISLSAARTSRGSGLRWAAG